MKTPTSKAQFTTPTNNSTFTRRHDNIHTTKVHLFRPPQPDTSDRPWIFTTTTTSSATKPTITTTSVILRHPLTSKPYSVNLPDNPDSSVFSQLDSSTIAASYHFDKPYPVDKLLVFPAPPRHLNTFFDTRDHFLLALHSGGQLQVCPRFYKIELSYDSPWFKINHREKFDDIIVFKDRIHVIDTKSWVHLLRNHNNSRTVVLWKTIMFWPVTRDSGGIGWRKRFVLDETELYLMVRVAEKLFRVYVLKNPLRWREIRDYNDNNHSNYWEEVTGFKGEKVLFIAKDYYFFLPALKEFPGTEYKNCMVFSEAAFPQYGIDCWEFTKSGDRQFSEDDIAVFRLDDQVFAREGENSDFPKIDWSPPAWITDEFPIESESLSLIECEFDENDGEVQSDLNNSVGKDGEEQEEMRSDRGSQDQDQGEVESDSDSQDQEPEKMQCDSNSQEKEEDGTHCKANVEGDALLQVDIVTPFLSPVEGGLRRTLVRMNSGNVTLGEETSGKNITHTMPNASTSSTTKRHKGDSATATFEGLDIRSDLVPTLQKIWLKHGNIIKDSIVRSGDIVAKALESLATMAQILEDKTAQSLSDSEADYVRTTLSDLRCIRFKVDWLISYVEKALNIHKSKDLVESLNNLGQLSSQVKARREILLKEVAKLLEEENILNEEMVKVSKMIPCSGKVKFDEPIGIGLT